MSPSIPLTEPNTGEYIVKIHFAKKSILKVSHYNQVSYGGQGEGETEISRSYQKVVFKKLFIKIRRSKFILTPKTSMQSLSTKIQSGINCRVKNLAILKL